MAYRIYGIVGEIKAGKGMVQERIQSSRDCDYTRFSMPLYDALARLGLPSTRENLQDLSTILRQGPKEVPPHSALVAWLKAGVARGSKAFSDRLTATLDDIFDLPDAYAGLDDIDVLLGGGYGEDLLARTIDLNCARARKDYVIADGIRRLADISILSRRPEYRLIYITAPFELRLAWAIAAAEKVGDADLTPEKFRAQCEAETEREIPLVGAAAHLRIDNVGTKEDAYRVLDAYLDSEDAIAYG